MGTRATSLTLFPRRFGTSATHADPIGHRGLGTPLGGPFRQKATSNRVAYDGSELSGSSLFVLSRHARESAQSGESQNTFWDICLAVSPKWGKHPSEAMDTSPTTTLARDSPPRTPRPPQATSPLFTTVRRPHVKPLANQPEAGQRLAAPLVADIINATQDRPYRRSASSPACAAPRVRHLVYPPVTRRRRHRRPAPRHARPGSRR